MELNPFPFDIKLDNYCCNRNTKKGKQKLRSKPLLKTNSLLVASLHPSLQGQGNVDDQTVTFSKEKSSSST